MPSRKSHIQFYADECFPVTSVTYLRSLGYSIIHAFDRKLAEEPDQKHLKESKKLKRILITLDRDFLYYTNVNLSGHPGIIVVSVSSAIPEKVNKACKKMLKYITPDLASGSIIRISASKLRKEKNGEVVFEKEL